MVKAGTGILLRNVKVNLRSGSRMCCLIARLLSRNTVRIGFKLSYLTQKRVRIENLSSLRRNAALEALPSSYRIL